MSKTMTGKRYSNDFKEQIYELNKQGKTVTKLSSEYGIYGGIFIMNHVMSDSSLEDSIQLAIKNGVNKKHGSIKMKYSNIAKLCDDLGIKVLTKIGRLDNYSKQNKEEFLKIFEMVSSEASKIKVY